MLRKLFGKKDQDTPTEEIVVSPLNGRIIPLEEVPDPVFSEKMMGDGIAVVPEDGELMSPVDGEVLQVFPTKHAVGIKTKSGLEILIHIGLETVMMKGEGFTSLVKEGDRVRTGQPLISFNVDLVKEKAKSTVTPIIITNGEKAGSVEKLSPDQAQAGTTQIMRITDIK
ncbi:PTS system IIA component, Glc family (TC 4.A.1) [Fictibacillus solisalsi]|uniref:PTS system IIA component, Glc family (TC 4.A.1) n=1 Tax=Fictibacillus solisalsi TaxID=459525 RepID=A0A1H0ABC3_9BACL|nr:PTS glucose transporter subunit IIA [Fictibacillus solisalsi]SDN30594.1 PTS system IIA component, Glc family (TC 4.A.1) [Fictibacillus solisalsi]